MIERVLGRPEGVHDLDALAAQLHRDRVLVTGAEGSIGSALVPLLERADIVHLATDVDSYDVTWTSVPRSVKAFNPSLVFHLAGAKHAPAGEADPAAVAAVNITGTRHVLIDFPKAHVVLSSTCKACHPETAYGASKLIAERMVLNAGGSVARLYNVVETAGNVFRLWERLPDEPPIPVTGCERYFISLREALALHLWAALLPPGRYTINPGERRDMPDVAKALYPDRPLTLIPARRGDRTAEPRHANHEFLTDAGHGIERIRSAHDEPVAA